MPAERSSGRTPVEVFSSVLTLVPGAAIWTQLATDVAAAVMASFKCRRPRLERNPIGYLGLTRRIPSALRCSGLLAKDRLIPFCYGASLHVYPSGMARDMGGGLKAYKLVVGRHAKIDDLVEIFAKGLDVIPASVAAQEQFFPRVACVASLVGAIPAMVRGLPPLPRPHDGRFPSQLPTCCIRLGPAVSY